MVEDKRLRKNHLLIALSLVLPWLLEQILNYFEVKLEQFSCFCEEAEDFDLFTC